MFLKTNLGYLSQIALKNMQLLIQMERQMREKWDFLHHPRLTSGGEGLNLL